VPEDSSTFVWKATGTDSINNKQELESKEMQPLSSCLVYKQTLVALSELDSVISFTYANERYCRISYLYAMAVHCCIVY
jgi:hypothetical protein